MSKRKEDEAPAAPNLGAWTKEADEARYAENAQLARSARTARAALAAAEVELEKVKQRLGLFEQLNVPRVAPPVWTVPAHAKNHHAIPSLLLTDVHWDEVVRASEVEGFNSYNRSIAQRRVEKAFTGAVRVVRDYMTGVTYDGFQLFLGGDLMSGIIHEELTESNEGSICESILTVVEPIEAGILLLAKEFGKVNVTAVVGNHGRRTRKPRAKNRARDNFDWLVYQLVARNLRSDKRITMDVGDAADASAQLYATRYRLTHGDQFKGGSGIAAELSPLLIGAHRKSKRQSMIGNPFDVMVMGHFHQTLWLPSKGVIMGGSVIGYSEYSYVTNQSPEPPQCSLWLTTPEHGITMAAPIFVQDRAAEGW